MHANKGVVSIILPDELRPVNLSSGEPIDLILSPIGIFSRMNFGQAIELVLGKAIRSSEQEILQTTSQKVIQDNLIKLSKLSGIIGEEKYQREILHLGMLIRQDPNIAWKFQQSVQNGGLFFEAPSFADFDIKRLQDQITQDYNIHVNDNILLPRKTIQFFQDRLKIDVPTPHSDVILENIFNGPMYISKLMQTAESKLSTRDFGEYKKSNKQPVRDMFGDGKSSKLGTMELDALLAHNALKTISEIRSVKSDAIGLKSDLVAQVLKDGVYTLPRGQKQSYTKQVIDSMITFLNEN